MTVSFIEGEMLHISFKKAWSKKIINESKLHLKITCGLQVVFFVIRHSCDKIRLFIVVSADRGYYL